MKKIWLAICGLMLAMFFLGCSGGGGDAPPRELNFAGRSISGYGNTSLSWFRTGFEGCPVFASTLVGDEADAEMETALVGLTSVSARVENGEILVRASDSVETVKFVVQFTDFEADEVTATEVNGVPVSSNNWDAFWLAFSREDFDCEDEPEPQPEPTPEPEPEPEPEPTPGPQPEIVRLAGDIDLSIPAGQQFEFSWEIWSTGGDRDALLQTGILTGAKAVEKSFEIYELGLQLVNLDTPGGNPTLGGFFFHSYSPTMLEGFLSPVQQVRGVYRIVNAPPAGEGVEI